MDSRDTQFFHAGANFARRQAEKEQQAIARRSLFMSKMAQMRQRNNDWAAYDNELAKQNEKYNELLAQQQEQQNENEELNAANQRMEQIAYAQQKRLELDNDISEQMSDAKVDYARDQELVKADTKEIVNLRNEIGEHPDQYINPQQNTTRAIDDLEKPRFKDFEYHDFLNYEAISPKEPILQNGYQFISKKLCYPFVELGLQSQKVYEGLKNWQQQGINSDVLKREQDKLQKQIASQGFFGNDAPAYRKKLTDLETGQVKTGSLGDLSLAASELRLRFYLTSTKNKQGVITEPNLAMLYRQAMIQEELEQQYPLDWQQGLATADDMLSQNGYAKEVATGKLMAHDFYKMLDSEGQNGELDKWTLIPRQIANYPNSGRLMQKPLYLDPYRKERLLYQTTGKLAIKDPRNPKMQDKMWHTLSNYFGDLAARRYDLIKYQKLKGYHDEILNPECNYTTYLDRWNQAHHGTQKDYEVFHGTKKAPQFATFSKIDDTSLDESKQNVKGLMQNG